MAKTSSLVEKIQNIIQTVYIKDVKPNGTPGGDFTAGLWVTRDLNTLEGSYPWVSLSLNQFTLQPGIYEIEASAPAHLVSRHKIKLRNVTTASDEAIGTNEYTFTGTGFGPASRSIIVATLNLLTTTTFEVQHRCIETHVTTGLGVESAFGVDEVYTTVKITKIG